MATISMSKSGLPLLDQENNTLEVYTAYTSYAL